MARRVRNDSFVTEDGRDVAIRPFALGDLDRMTTFVNQIVKEKKTNRDLGISSFDKRATRAFEGKFLRSMIALEKDRKAVARAAFSSGKMVGTCTIRRREQSDMRHVGLFGIVVLDGYRGVGLGERLMREVLQAARSMGIWLVELEVLTMNRGAMHLYEKGGFRASGVVPGKIVRDGRELDIMVMYADLRGTDKSPSGRRRER